MTTFRAGASVAMISHRIASSIRKVLVANAISDPFDLRPRFCRKVCKPCVGNVSHGLRDDLNGISNGSPGDRVIPESLKRQTRHYLLQNGDLCEAIPNCDRWVLRRLRNPNCLSLDAVPHQRVKSVPRRNRYRDAECLRDLVLDLHETEHVGNFRGGIIVDEKVEIAARSLGATRPRAEHEKPSGAILAQTSVIGSEDLDQIGSIHARILPESSRQGETACKRASQVR
jgi:hypothetical protein